MPARSAVEEASITRSSASASKLPPKRARSLSACAAKAAALNLSADEIATMEHLAGEMQLDVIRYWEKEMK